MLSYAIVGVVLAAGIAYFWVDASNRHPKATCLLLIDRTGSSDEVATVNSYADMGRKAADGCKSLQAQTAVFYFDQRQAKLIAAGADNSFDLSRLDADSVVSAIDDVLKSPSGDERSSDILVPLDQAADNLRLMSADVGGSAHLIVLSDGLHLGSEVSVEQITEDPGSIQPLIREAARLDLVPDLDGVQVDFMGTRTGRGVGTDTTPDWFEANLERFWRTLLVDGGAKVCRYGTEATSLPSEC